MEGGRLREGTPSWPLCLNTASPGWRRQILGGPRGQHIQKTPHLLGWLLSAGQSCGAILASCLVSLEDKGLCLVHNWPRLWSDVTSGSQHHSQPPDASTVLGHLLTKGQKQEACRIPGNVWHYMFRVKMVCVHTCTHAPTCDHMRKNQRADWKPVF